MQAAGRQRGRWARARRLATQVEGRRTPKRGRPKSRFFTVAARIAKGFEPAMADAFTQAVLRLQESINEAALRAALASGSLPNIEMAAGAGRLGPVLGGDPTLLGALLGSSTATGRAGADILTADLGFTVQFNARHPDVVLFAREQAAQMVVQVADDVKEAIRIVVAAGADLGLTPMQQARAIRTVVGLPPQHALAPENLGADLRAGRAGAATSRRLSAVDKAVIRRRINAGTVTEAFVEEMQGKYTRSLINLRAQTIARTETIRSAHFGQMNGWQQAIEQGALPATSVRFWVVTPDDRLAHWMVPGMNPNGRGMGEFFDTPEGQYPYPPSRPNCRCGVGLGFPGQPGVL